VGAMTVTIRAGEDGVLGTADDEVEIKPTTQPVKARYSMEMTKKELLALAEELEVPDVTPRLTKAQIIEALDDATK